MLDGARAIWYHERETAGGIARRDEVESMKKDRQASILELLEARSICSTKELAEELHCTEMTIRRDLDELEQMSLVARRHGCAYVTSNAKPHFFFEQAGEQHNEKMAIAQAAVQFIKPYSMICIDTGTTANAVAKCIPDMPLSIITTSIITALEISNKENIQLFMLGGILNHRTKSLMCTDVETVKKRQADIAFISSRSFGIPGGATENTYSLIETKRLLVAMAKKIVLLIDHTKCERVSLCSSIPLSDIHTIITDSGTDPGIISKAVAIDKEVVVADPETKKIVQHYNKC